MGKLCHFVLKFHQEIPNDIAQFYHFLLDDKYVSQGKGCFLGRVREIRQVLNRIL